MNEFTSMIREAFLGEEPFDANPGRQAIQLAIEKFERRDRVIRLLSWFCVAFMGGVALWAGLSFWKADETTSPKQLILYATLFLCAFGGVGFGKLMLFSLQANFAVMRELKRTHLALLDQRTGRE